MKRIIVIIALLLLGAPFVAAAEPRQCDPTGTWYDEGFNYLGTITRNADGTYTGDFRASYDLGLYGYGAGTDWSLHMVRRGPRYFELNGMCLYSLATEDPATPAVKEIDIIHSFMRLKDGCDTIVHTIDVFGGYVPMAADKVPFVTEFDVDFLTDGAPLVEIYHRMKQLK